MRLQPLSSSKGFTPFNSYAGYARPNDTDAFSTSNHINRAVLMQVIFCALPVAGLLYIGELQLAGYWFWGVLGLLLVHFILQRFIFGRKRLGLVGLLLGVAPLLNYLRGIVLFYNTVVVVLFIGIWYFYSLYPEEVRAILRRNRLVVFLLAYVSAYYLLSLTAGSYWVNLRGFELVLTLLLVLLLGSTRKDLLATALLGMLISAIAVAIGFWPHPAYEDRLGMATIGGHLIGNPATLGRSLALGFLGLVVDRGEWLKLDGKGNWRMILLVVTTLLLGLSASRVSWLVAAGGVFVAILWGSRQRTRIPLALFVILAVSIAILQTPMGDDVREWLDRSFNPERSWANRTSGRSDQWIVGWYALTDSFGSLVGGYGPGQGPSVYARYSLLLPGIIYEVGHFQAWHSYLLQIGVEMGLLGLTPFIIWLVVAFYRVVRRTRINNTIFPLVCFIGYILIILTVSGYDTVSGIFLGICLLGSSPMADNKCMPAESSPI